jgi:hypothetical protein
MLKLYLEDKTSIKIKLCDILDHNPWKAWLHHAMLRKVVPFFPDSWFQTCLQESAEQTGEYHAPHMTPLTLPQNIIHHVPWAD